MASAARLAPPQLPAGPMGPAGGDPTGRTAACRMRKHTREQRSPTREPWLVLGQTMQPSRPLPMSSLRRHLYGHRVIFSHARSMLVRHADAPAAPRRHEACGQQMRTELSPRIFAPFSSLPAVRQTGRFCGLYHLVCASPLSVLSGKNAAAMEMQRDAARLSPLRGPGLQHPTRLVGNQPAPSDRIFHKAKQMPFPDSTGFSGKISTC